MVRLEGTILPAAIEEINRQDIEGELSGEEHLLLVLRPGRRGTRIVLAVLASNNFGGDGDRISNRRVQIDVNVIDDLEAHDEGIPNRHRVPLALVPVLPPASHGEDCDVRLLCELRRSADPDIRVQ